MYECRTNYESEKKKKESQSSTVSVFRFPSEKTDPVERERWIAVVGKINKDFKLSNDTVICEVHWPAGYEKIKKKGRFRPKNPPSIFKGIPSSIIPSPPVKPRETTCSQKSNQDRNTFPDEITDFDIQDKLSFNSLVEDINKRDFQVEFTSFTSEDDFYIQSTKYFKGIPKFVIVISELLKFEAFHLGVKCNITTLTLNRQTLINRWSIIDEIIRFLNNKEPDNHMDVLMEQVSVMCTVPVGTKLYSVEIIVRAFEYFATSRSLYNRLIHDYKLPSIKTLTRLTSKVSKLSDANFILRIFNSLSTQQQLCIILFDEVYVKKMMTYHAGSVFGRAINNPEFLANSVLGIMVDCMFGGPTFLSSMLPVAKLNSSFLNEHIAQTIEDISSSGGHVNVLVCDDNRTNQKFFSNFDVTEEKPWLTTDGRFLLFDYVHLTKSLRNNWVTEKTGELQYSFDGQNRTAKWCHLVTLYKAESSSGLLQMSKLNESAVMPKNTEKQSVPLCLRVFCDRTSTALVTHPATKDIPDIKDTSFFIDLVVKFWKIVNVKRKGDDVRENDPLKAVITDPYDKRLDFIIQFGDMCLRMKSQPRHRQKQLTRDTALAAYQTCNGMVELVRYLLSTSHQYVALGKFTTDKLEKAFSKLRQGSGGTYFITVQQILEKNNIYKTNLLLKHLDIEELPDETGHFCALCNYKMDEESAEVFDNLTTLESSLTIDTKNSLVYIAGYVTRRDGDLSETDLLDITTFYYQKYGSFTDKLDRGMLNIPNDGACQWTFFSYILFMSVKEKVCRRSLSTLLLDISRYYSFNMTSLHSTTLSNILIKNFCIQSTPRSSKEASQKVLKLS